MNTLINATEYYAQQERDCYQEIVSNNLTISWIVMALRRSPSTPSRTLIREELEEISFQNTELLEPINRGDETIFATRARIARQKEMLLLLIGRLNRELQ